MVVAGRQGAFWFFFIAILVAATVEVLEDFVRTKHSVATKEAQERNELVAKQLAELNGQVQQDIRELKAGVFQVKSTLGFDSQA